MAFKYLNGMAMAGIVYDAASAFVSGRTMLLEASGMSQTVFYIHAGLLIFTGAYILLRRRLRSSLPLIVVIALAFQNEIANHLAGRGQSNPEALSDIATAAFWPAALFLLMRSRKG
ncbi:hypothetical protein RM533_10885 [Croceicoccus sp. F390]|uniref:Uncharacterized protein n=1 Tax=Croceicoccus esteveae TaxID=3075597 RepID=A0ABU2ZJA1_9SPHN|nr:hypothetical protein [Croceicoccus sp. F390]MDT0576682.1 hypothetical protein [Croceicoccus sp. F390]